MRTSKQSVKKGHSKDIGATALALHDTGMIESEIGKALGISHSTVSEIIRGVGKWATLTSDVQMEAYRKEQRHKHEVAMHELSTTALERIEKTLPYASVGQAVMTLGVLQDKIRLLSNESTQNIKVAVSVEADKLTETLNKLLGSLKEEKVYAEATIVDVTTEGNTCVTNGAVPPSDDELSVQPNGVTFPSERPD